MLTEQEKQELNLLLEKKKKEKLVGKEWKRFQELMAKIKGIDKKSTTLGPGNDFSWWNKAPELLKDAANVKSNWIPGRPLDEIECPVVVPGVCTIDYYPVYGSESKATDPINVFARDLYLKMFQKYRGISAYSSSDLVIALIASHEAVRMIAKLERIYGVINRYSRKNVNMPFTEERGLGLTHDQADYIRDHLSDFRYDLNMLIRKAQRLCIPKDMSIIANSISLLGYEYCDHDNVKAQIIIFDSKYFGVFSDTALSTGGSIQFSRVAADEGAGVFSDVPLIDFHPTTSGFTNMFPALELMLGALLGSDGIQKIFGDLVTWFGDEQLLHILPLSEDYIVAPVYSESILHKMHNIDPFASSALLASVYPSGMPSADVAKIKPNDTLQGPDVSYWIYQFNDVVISKLAAVCDDPGSLFNFHTQNKLVYPGRDSSLVGLVEKATPMDTYRADVTEETITEGTIWKNVHKEILWNGADTTEYVSYAIEGCAFEYIREIVMYTLEADGTVSGYNISTNVSANANAVYAACAALGTIDWAPMVYRLDPSESVISKVYGDVDTMIPMYPGTKKKILDCVVISGFHTDVKVVDKPNH